MRVEITPAEIGDADVLAPRLRDADREELKAMDGLDTAASIRGAISASRGRVEDMAFAVWIDGRLVCLFGFIPAGALANEAHPWLLASDEVERIPSILTKQAGRYCSALLGDYPVLFNYVDARNTRSIEWLKRIGFSLQPAEPFGVGRLPFHRFEMRG